MCIKCAKYTDLARYYFDMEAVVESEAEIEGTEEEEDGSFINDRASENDQASALSDPQQDEAAWYILEEAQHILSTVKVATPSGGSYHQSACAWFEKVAELEIPASSEVTHHTIKSFIEDKISSSHAYHLLEVKFSDNPMAMVHWESVLDAVIDADTHKARLQIFDTQMSNMVEHVMSSAVLSAALVWPCKGTGVLEEFISSIQDVRMQSAPELLTWLITVPSAQLKSKGFKVYTHSMLLGHLCIKAKDTYIIRKAWPSTHASCFFDVLFLPQEDQVSSKPNMTIPGWYHPICRQYWHDMGYRYLFDLQTDTIMLLVASREIPEQDIEKDLHVLQLYNSVPSSVGQKKTYIYDLLVLRLHRTAVIKIQIPAPESITLHQESRYNSAFMQSTLHVYATQHWMEGDLVRIRAGEMFGCTVKIDCVDMSTHLASVHMEELVHIEKVSHKPLMFPISDLEWKFHVGDTVHVLNNTTVAIQLKGKIRMIIKANDDMVDVVDQSSDLEFTVAIDSLATFIGDICKQAPTITSINDNFPMKAGDILQVIRGNLLYVSGMVLCMNLNDKTLTFKDMLRQEVTTSITYVTRIHEWVDCDLMWHLLSNEVFIIHGPMKSYERTLQLLSQDRCEVAIQGQKQEFMHAHITRSENTLLALICSIQLMYMQLEGSSPHQCLHQLREFLKLVQSSFVQLPDVAPPQTPHHSLPPDEPTPAVQGSVWDASIKLLGLDWHPSPTKDDPWTFNKTDREEHLLHPPDLSASSTPCMA
ncbi:hypothetical protein BDR04DRAFT_1122276 [Suillus decipiens]|nr:hypothetical protein BDR04DRAFT_1122276 [Suillus decipiens]